MRLTLCEDEDFPGQAFLWEANLERSLKGKKGQASLRELEFALLALPEKRLITDELENLKGEVCALGALARFKGKENPKTAKVLETDDDAYYFDDDDRMETASVELAATMGVPKMVALAIVYVNDDEWQPLTPEQRYDKVLKWTRRQLNAPARDAGTTTAP